MRQRRDPGGHMHRNAAHIVGADFDLPGVKAGADFDPQRPNRGDQRQRAMDGASRPVEGGKKSIAERLDLGAPEARQLAAEYRMMGVEQLAPTLVADGLRALGRIDNVGEENRRQGALAANRGLHTGEKFGDLVGDLFDVVAEVRQMIDSRHSRSRAFGMLFANCRPPSTLTTGSWVRWTTSVGTRT